jgi:hypothetical protein
MFRTVSPSIIRSLRLYIQHQVYVIQVRWLLDSGKEMERWDCPKHVVLFLNKINFRYSAASWFYCRNILRWTVLQTAKPTWCLYRPFSHYCFLKTASVCLSVCLLHFCVFTTFYFSSWISLCLFPIRFHLVVICSVRLLYFTSQFPYFVYLYLYRPYSCVSVTQRRISYFLFAFCLYFTEGNVYFLPEILQRIVSWRV